MGAKAGTKKSAEQSRHPAIEVKDFGPIAQGKVELRPLTVFAGPSNTGKTWLATMVYAMFRHKIWDWMTLTEYARNYTFDGKLRRPSFPENPDAWISSIEKEESIKFTSNEKKFLEAYLESDENKGKIEDQVKRCYGLSNTARLIQEGAAGKATVKFQSNPTDLHDQYVLNMEFKGNDFAYSVNYPDSIYAPIHSFSKGKLLHGLEQLQEYDETFGGSSVDSIDELEVKTVFRSIAFYNALNELYSNNNFEETQKVWYLPADRGGIMHTHHDLLGGVLQSASRPRTHGESSAPGLSGAITDFLENLTRLGQMSKEERYASPKSADTLENNVIGGKVVVERNPLDYPSFYWQPAGWKRTLPTLNVSSMVTELAPVALYLRHYVHPGDLLIIDEPEAHLHPSRQVDFINEIAGWVRSGIRVILTTHSDWVLEALSNLVAESQLEEHLLQDKVAESQAGETAGLRKEDVGFWLFEQGKRGGGAKIREVPWDADEGGFEADFYDTAARLHNRWAYLVEKFE